MQIGICFPTFLPRAKIKKNEEKMKKKWRRKNGEKKMRKNGEKMETKWKEILQFQTTPHSISSFYNIYTSGSIHILCVLF